MQKATKEISRKTLEQLLLRKRIAERTGVELANWEVQIQGIDWPIEVIVPRSLSAKLSADNADAVEAVLIELDRGLRAALGG